MLNTAVFAPMPRAKVRTTMTVNPGDFANRRNACFRSCIFVFDASGGDPSDVRSEKVEVSIGELRPGPPARSSKGSLAGREGAVSAQRFRIQTSHVSGPALSSVRGQPANLRASLI